MGLICTMIRGDCLEVLPSLPKASAQLMFLDMPYGATGFAWDKKIPLEQVMQLSKHALGGSGPVITTGNEKYMLEMTTAWSKALRYVLIWDKSYPVGAFHASRRPMVSHEYVLVFGATPTYNSQKTCGHKAVKKTGEKYPCKFTPGLKVSRAGQRLDLDESRHPVSILRFTKDKRQRKTEGNSKKTGTHPSQKPVALLDWLIRTYSNPSNHVIDPVSGSATTAISALQNGRNVTCIEKDASFFEAGVERVRKHVQDNAIDATIEVRT